MIIIAWFRKHFQSRVKTTRTLNTRFTRGERVYLVSRAFIPRDIGGTSREKEGEEEREGK